MWAEGTQNTAAQQAVIGIALRRACARPVDNARLALLCGGPLDSDVPDMDIFRSAGECEAFAASAPKCGEEHVRRIVKKNAFAGEEDDATGLWVLASFMNHEPVYSMTTIRTFEGPVMVVRAARDLPAGTELTTLYFNEGRGSAESWGF